MKDYSFSYSGSSNNTKYIPSGFSAFVQILYQTLNQIKTPTIKVPG